MPDSPTGAKPLDSRAFSSDSKFSNTSFETLTLVNFADWFSCLVQGEAGTTKLFGIWQQFSFELVLNMSFLVIILRASGLKWQEMDIFS
jgi:hypothetical protein